jgi:hypothetical protein
MAVVNDIYLARMVCFNPGVNAQYSINVRSYLCTATLGTGATDAQIAASIEGLVATQFKAAISSFCSWWGCSVQRYRPTLGPTTPAIALRGVGLGSATPCPAQVAGLIKLQTALGGKRGRGRAFVPFPGVGSVSGSGQAIAAYTTSLVNLGTVLVAGFTSGVGGNTNTFQPVLVNRLTFATNLILSASPSFPFSQQRRRSQLRRPDVAPFA